MGWRVSSTFMRNIGGNIGWEGGKWYFYDKKLGSRGWVGGKWYFYEKIGETGDGWGY